jgi:hypothetical protein
MIPDPTGRFAERPFYKAEELDRECEQIVTKFLRKRRGEVRFPISTDDLHVLIEDEGADLDSCVDLSAYGEDVEGVAIFYPDRGPDSPTIRAVKIAGAPPSLTSSAMSGSTATSGLTSLRRVTCSPGATWTTRQSASAIRF